MEIAEAEVKHSVYVYKCTDCVLQVRAGWGRSLQECAGGVVLVAFAGCVCCGG